MREHLHTGFPAFIFAGASAVVFINLLRFLAIWASDKPQFDWLAHMIGGAINWGPVSTRNEVSDNA